MTELPAALRALAAPTARLGLPSGRVSVVDYNPRWPELYAGVAGLLATELAGFDAQIEHVGSTSVPGLAAKPVLDIAVGATAPIDDNAYVAAIERAGFTFITDLGMYGGLFFTAAVEPEVAVAHVHVVDVSDFQWRWYRTLRDGLRQDPALRKTYEDLKRQAADANGSDRDGYNQAKFDWLLATVSELDAN